MLNGDKYEWKLIYSFNVVLSLFLIFTSVNMQFARLFRNMLLFNSIFIINKLYLFKAYKRIMVYLYFISMSIVFFWIANSSSNVGQILRSNLLFK